MNILSRSSVVVIAILCASNAWVNAQSKATPPHAGANPASQLVIAKTTRASEMAVAFEMPIRCDSDGAVYLKTNSDGISSIHAINASGERAGAFTAAQCPDVKVQVAGQFTIGNDGRIYQLYFPQDNPRRGVMVFDHDGTCRSKITLDTPFSFIPYQIATFPSGTMLIGGLRSSTDPQVQAAWPYTALFSSSGTILKAVELEDDGELHKRGAEGDPKVSPPNNPQGNSAIARGAVQIAADGNAYLLRRTSPAIVYAISEGGAVVRRFTIDPGESDLLPTAMHISGSRIAVLFRNARTNQSLMKVVDLEGQAVAEYTEPVLNGRGQLGLAFACYQFPPDRFTFLTTLDDDTVGLRIAEPKR